jgi:hypothetical protein
MAEGKLALERGEMRRWLRGELLGERATVEMLVGGIAYGEWYR